MIDAGSREAELKLRVAVQKTKLEQTKMIMDEQEHEPSLYKFDIEPTDELQRWETWVSPVEIRVSRQRW